MARPALTDLTALSAIASHRSFRKAADELGLSASTLSHMMMRALERDLGVRLLHRTTRSVATTEAGERLVARLPPVLRDLDRARAEVDDFRQRPSGTLRINAAGSAARLLLRSVVPCRATPRWRSIWSRKGVWSTSSRAASMPASGWPSRFRPT